MTQCWQRLFLFNCLNLGLTLGIQLRHLKVLTHTRRDSVARLLNGLIAAEYGGQEVSLEIFVDAPRSEAEVKLVAQVATFCHGFAWPFGPKSVTVHERWHGIRRQWLQAWPEPAEGEAAVILEDDLEVSPAFFHYAQAALEAYDARSNVAGVSLQRLTLQMRGRGPLPPVRNGDRPFLAQTVGPWGFAPLPRVWRAFLAWISSSADLDIEVPGHHLTHWYREALASQTEHSIWTLHFTRFCEDNALLTLYMNFPNHQALVISHREQGEHFNGGLGPDARLLEGQHREKLANFSADDALVSVDYDGRRLDYGYSDFKPSPAPAKAGNGSTDGTGVCENEKSAVEDSPPLGDDIMPGECLLVLFGSSSSLLVLLLGLVLYFGKSGQSKNLPAIAKVKPILSASLTTAELCVWLLMAFLGEHLVPTRPVEQDADVFWASMIMVLVVSLVLTRQVKDDAVMNRAQTSEWRGWMQVAFVMYHYAGYMPAYGTIRVLVSAFVWQTGWGNSMYFKKTGDYSLSRVLQMLFRLNFFPFFLSLTTSTPWILYYIVALHNAHFFLVYFFGLFGGFSPRLFRLSGRGVVLAKILLLIPLISLLHSVWIWQGMDEVLRFFFGDFFAYYFEFRTSLDRYSSISGMIVGYFWNDLCSLFSSKLWPKVMLVVVSLGMFATWVGISWGKEGKDYRDVHPYISVLPIPLYVLLRNCTPSLRKTVVWPLEMLGEASLEIYLLQYHLFMSKKAQRIMVLHHLPIVNLLATAALVWYASRRCFVCTDILRKLLTKIPRRLLCRMPKLFFVVILVQVAVALVVWVASQLEREVALPIICCVGFVDAVVLTITHLAYEKAKPPDDAPVEKLSQTAPDAETPSKDDSAQLPSAHVEKFIPDRPIPGEYKPGEKPDLSGESLRQAANVELANVNIATEQPDAQLPKDPLPNVPGEGPISDLPEEADSLKKPANVELANEKPGASDQVHQGKIADIATEKPGASDQVASKKGEAKVEDAQPGKSPKKSRENEVDAFLKRYAPHAPVCVLCALLLSRAFDGTSTVSVNQPPKLANSSNTSVMPSSTVSSSATESPELAIDSSTDEDVTDWNWTETKTGWTSLYELDASCFQIARERDQEEINQSATVPDELVIRRSAIVPAADKQSVTVTLELAGVNGKRALACQDFLRVVMMSGNEAHVVPYVKVSQDGVYNVRAQLWPTKQRFWHVILQREWKAFQVNFTVEPVEQNNLDGCQKDVSVVVKDKDKGLQMKNQWLGLLARTRRVIPTFTLDPFGATQPGSPPTIGPCTRTQLITASGYQKLQWNENSFTLAPPDCTLSPANTARVVDVLQNKWVLFIGDSTLEELFYGILSYSLELEPSVGFPEGYGNFKDGIHPDLLAAAEPTFIAEAQSSSSTVCKSRYYDSRKGALPDGMRLTFLWNADKEPCGAYVGLNSFKFHSFRSRLRKLLREGPDVVVFNSGLHDIRPVTLNGYTANLRSAWDFIQQTGNILPGRPSRHYIWKSTTPLFKGAECDPWQATGNSGLKILNQRANAIASARGADIFDQWAVRYLAPEEGGDGVHCRHTVSYSTSLALLLRHLELGPK